MSANTFLIVIAFAAFGTGIWMSASKYNETKDIVESIGKGYIGIVLGGAVTVFTILIYYWLRS